MNRVSTNGNYSAVLANIMAAQSRQIEAGNEVATQKKGQDLKDYARNAEMLTAMRSIETRLGGYIDQNTQIADKLTTQDLAINQVADAADGTRQAIANALASGRADTLMQDVQGFFHNGVDWLNTRYGGKYVFAGGQIDTPPVSATAMSDLTQPATVIADFFHNDSFVTQAKIDDSTTVNTGMLADGMGTAMMTSFKDIQAFQEGGSGPFGGTLTTAQRTFLEGQLATWDTVHKGLIDQAARTGTVQARVDQVKRDVDNRQSSLQGMIGGITDADLAQAAAKLQQAQTAVQASAQVFLSLQNASLLNFLK